MQTKHPSLSVCAGPIDFRHAFLDMTQVVVKKGPYTRAGRTCPAAMGFSFAAGTTDGMFRLVVLHRKDVPSLNKKCSGKPFLMLAVSPLNDASRGPCPRLPLPRPLHLSSVPRVALPWKPS